MSASFSIKTSFDDDATSRDSVSLQPRNRLPGEIVQHEEVDGLSYAGFVYKLSDNVKAWRLRYFVLEDNRLIHFRTEKDIRPRRIIQLDQCELTSEEPWVMQNKFAISIHLKYLDRTYVLGHEDVDVVKEWMIKIQDSQNTKRKSDKNSSPTEEKSSSLQDITSEKIENLNEVSDDVSRTWSSLEVDSLGARIWSRESECNMNGSQEKIELSVVILQCAKILFFTSLLFCTISFLKAFLLSDSWIESYLNTAVFVILHRLLCSNSPRGLKKFNIHFFIFLVLLISYLVLPSTISWLIPVLLISFFSLFVILFFTKLNYFYLMIFVIALGFGFSSFSFV